MILDKFESTWSVNMGPYYNYNLFFFLFIVHTLLFDGFIHVRNKGVVFHSVGLMTKYNKTSVAQTLMARLPRLFGTHS